MGLLPSAKCGSRARSRSAAVRELGGAPPRTPCTILSYDTHSAKRSSHPNLRLIHSIKSEKKSSLLQCMNLNFCPLSLMVESIYCIRRGVSFTHLKRDFSPENYRNFLKLIYCS